jgi:hypothetical protein
LLTVYDELRRRHFASAMAQLPGHLARQDWTSAQIRVERGIRLDQLVGLAKERSPWHRARLVRVDPATLTAERLPEIPPMTKDDLLANFDSILTDHRLSLGQVEQYLARLTSDAYLLDEFHAIASGVDPR